MAILLALQLASQSAPVAEASGRSTIKVVKKTLEDPDETKRTPTPAPTRPATLTPAPTANPVTLPSSPVAHSLPTLNVTPPADEGPAITLESTPPKDGPRILPWVTLGASGAAALVGAVFAVRTMDAVDALGELDAKVSGTKVSLPDEFKDQQKAVFTNGLAATLLLSSAVAGAIASSVILASD